MIIHLLGISSQGLKPRQRNTDNLGEIMISPKEEHHSFYAITNDQFLTHVHTCNVTQTEQGYLCI